MKKNLVLFSMLLVMVSALVFVQMSPVFAAEEKIYQSNGSIGFYGQYEYLAPEKPDGSQVIEMHPDSSHILPQTGGKSNNLNFFAGITIILFSIFIMFRIEKKSKEEMLNEIS